MSLRKSSKQIPVDDDNPFASEPSYSNNGMTAKTINVRQSNGSTNGIQPQHTSTPPSANGTAAGDYTSSQYEPPYISPLETQYDSINKKLIDSHRNAPNTWKQRGKNLLQNDVFWGIVILVVCILIAVITMLIYQSVEGSVNFKQFEDPQHEQIIIIIVAGVFAFCALVITTIQVVQHLRNYHHPPSQRRIIRILLLVPVFGIFAWLSCIFLDVELYFQSIIDCYESYVVYCFLILLTKYLGGHQGVAAIFESKGTIEYLFPLNYMPYTRKGIRGSNNLVWYIKWGTLQYCWFGITCAIITLITNTLGVYEDGVFDMTKAYVYITIIINCSQVVALYCLIWLYQICKNELRPFKPFYKFIAIKALVFFTFWQSVLVSGLAYIHILAPTSCNVNDDITCQGNPTGFTVTEEKVLIENVLVCIEVFGFSIAHHYVFNVNDYKTGEIQTLMEQRALQQPTGKSDNYNNDDALVDGDEDQQRNGQHTIEMTNTKQVSNRHALA